MPINKKIQIDFNYKQNLDILIPFVSILYYVTLSTLC